MQNKLNKTRSLDIIQEGLPIGRPFLFIPPLPNISLIFATDLKKPEYEPGSSWINGL